MVSGAPDYWLKGKYIELIETINRIKLVDEITKIARITNISNIASVDLIDRITLIDAITKIGEITSIRDLALNPLSIFVNPSFEQDFVGWDYVNCTITTAKRNYGYKSCQLSCVAPASWVRQSLYIPIKTSWFSALSFYAYGTIGQQILGRLSFTDGAVHTQYFTFWSAGFDKFTFSGYPDKYVERILFNNPSVTDDCYLDDILMVF